MVLMSAVALLLFKAALFVCVLVLMSAVALLLFKAVLFVCVCAGVNVGCSCACVHSCFSCHCTHPDEGYCNAPKR
jgi:hypothetical protein